jgi:steroid delta-isomerase-like uncharacterized protein
MATQQSTSTAAEDGSESPATQEKTAGELARGFFEHVGSRDVEGMARYWDDESVDDFIVLGPVRGKEALSDFFREFFGAFPDAEFELERITAEGDTAAVQYRFTGTFSGDSFQGIKATGKPVEFRGTDIITFVGEKVRMNSVYYDGLSFARQIGMMPPEDSTADKAMTGAFNALTDLRNRLPGGGKG